MGENLKKKKKDPFQGGAVRLLLLLPPPPLQCVSGRETNKHGVAPLPLFVAHAERETAGFDAFCESQTRHLNLDERRGEEARCE